MPRVIGYSSPFVPPEWIDAHGLTPLRWLPQANSAVPEGVCPFAGALIPLTVGSAEEPARTSISRYSSNRLFCGPLPVDSPQAFILTTTCDQLRRVGERAAAVPLFLMNIPATWQSPTTRSMYVEELHRLGKWLVMLGGRVPTDHDLAAVMRRYDTGRSNSRETLTPALSRGTGRGGIPLALVGGPLRPQDQWIFDCVLGAGGRVALDATETGQRTLPAPFNETQVITNPVEELTRAYFDTIPDAFRRPDTLLHDYLTRELAKRQIRGILLVRYLWCDQWHAQLGRIKESTGLPVVEIDLGGQDRSLERTRNRIEALINILQ